MAEIDKEKSSALVLCNVYSELDNSIVRIIQFLGLYTLVFLPTVMIYLTKKSSILIGREQCCFGPRITPVQKAEVPVSKTIYNTSANYNNIGRPYKILEMCLENYFNFLHISSCNSKCLKFYETTQEICKNEARAQSFEFELNFQPKRF